MQIILSKDFREFIAGIFSAASDADKFRQETPKEAYSKLEVEEIQLEYPFYISENHEGFSYHSEASAKELVAGFIPEMHEHDKDWCYTNLYCVKEDFIPKVPGKDYMGLLPHHHIDNDTLEDIKKNGFNSLWDQ